MRLTEEEMFEIYINPSPCEYEYCPWCMEEVPVTITEIDLEEGGTDTLVDCQICDNRILEAMIREPRF